MWVRPLGLEDPLEEGITFYSSIVAREIPWTEEPGQLQSIGLQSKTWLKWLSMHTNILKIIWLKRISKGRIITVWKCSWQLYKTSFLFTGNFWGSGLSFYYRLKAAMWPNNSEELMWRDVVQEPGCVRLFVTSWTVARQIPCSPLSPRACSNSHPLSQWYHPTISLFATSFSSCLQFFPASGSFPVSQLFASGGQSISASAPVHPRHIKNWFPLGMTGLISFLSKGLSWVFFSITVLKPQFFSTQPSLWSDSHIYAWLLGTFVNKVMSLLFNMLSRFVMAFLRRNKHFLISWLQSPSTVILEPKKIKSLFPHLTPLLATKW